MGALRKENSPGGALWVVLSLWRDTRTRRRVAHRAPLPQLHPEIAVRAAHLFKPRDTIRYRLYGRSQGKSKTHANYKTTGPVTVAYRRKETPSGTVQEKFLDAGQN